ncbi:hypothetical protein BU16DRAFT_535516 [Lophium mytilinum]|uniref:RING-type domain-containing protein n=1 Tax=Lophium mytilinum TaxID=390894 RepID=A0A6A6R5B6_9PEZI|nr:hypothetical protein BU16DRAFT_535516 [Lophium mytilinum]
MSEHLFTTVDATSSCPICKNPFALHPTDRILLAAELAKNAYNADHLDLDLDILVRPQCGHDLGLFCLQRWMDLGHSTCPYCTLTMLNDTGDAASIQFLQPMSRGMPQEDDELMVAVNEILKAWEAGKDKQQGLLPTWWNGEARVVGMDRGMRYEYLAVILDGANARGSISHWGFDSASRDFNGRHLAFLGLGLRTVFMPA